MQQQIRQTVNRLISQKQQKFRGSKLTSVKTAFQIFQQLKKDVHTFLALPHPEERQLDELNQKLDKYRQRIIDLLPPLVIPVLRNYVREMDEFLDEIKQYVRASYYMKVNQRSRVHPERGDMFSTQSPTQGAGSRHSDDSFHSADQQHDTDSSFHSFHSAVSQHDRQSDTVSQHDRQSDTVSQQDQQSDTDSGFYSANYGQIPPVSDSPRRSQRSSTSPSSSTGESQVKTSPRRSPRSSTSPSPSTGGTSQVKTSPRRSPRSSTLPLPSTEGRRRTLLTNFPKRNPSKNLKHALKQQLPLTAVGLMTIVAFAVSLGFALSKTK